MSLQSFQSALAYAIRSFDADNKRGLEDLTRIYDLSGDEKITLKNLIYQQRLRAYSEELFLARWTIIREALEFLQPFVEFKALSNLWEQDFEPKSTNVFHEELVLKFTEYLVFDERGSKFISMDTPAFLPSLVRYLHTVLTFKHNHLPKHTLSPDSMLSNRYFSIIELEYDVREFFAELIELTDYKDLRLAPPPKRQLTLLFIASDEVTEFRSFEVDQEISTFLEAQLRGERPPAKLLSCYDDLVEIGLCKPHGVRLSCCNNVH